MKLLSIIGLLVGLLLSLGATSASANVIYDFIPLTETGNSLDGQPIPLSFFDPQIAFSDSAVASGHLSLIEFCNFVPAPRGCYPFPPPGVLPVLPIVDNPVIINETYGPAGDVDRISLELNLSLTFNLDGTLTGDIHYLDNSAKYDVSGGGDFWGGTMNTDLLECDNGGPNVPCDVTGYWQADPAVVDALLVPEPMSAAILAPPLLYLFFLTRRRALR